MVNITNNKLDFLLIILINFSILISFSILITVVSIVTLIKNYLNSTSNTSLLLSSLLSLSLLLN